MDQLPESSQSPAVLALPLRTIIVCVVTGCVFFAAMAAHVLSYIPGLYCENFGCIVHGIIYVALGVVISVVYAVFAAIKNHKQKARAFFTALLIMGICIGAAFAGMSDVNQAQIRQGYKDAEEACREYPQLCPDK